MTQHSQTDIALGAERYGVTLRCSAGLLRGDWMFKKRVKRLVNLAERDELSFTYGCSAMFTGVTFTK